MSLRTKKPEDSASGSQDSGASGDAFPRPIAPRRFPAGPPPAALLALPVVERSRYAIEGDIARGGVGRILRARDTRLGRAVAIKEMRFDPLGPGAERFVREVMITAKLAHPSIVTLYEAGRWPSGEPFFAMELVAGRSLAAALSERKLLEDRLPMLPHVIAAAEAMGYAHSRRIIHRDLKPSNILVGSFGETVVIDWGLAKDLADTGAAPEPSPPAIAPLPGAAVGLTGAGAVVGTPAYMPPEQAAAEPVDETADVYALGAILYHVVAGVAPYDGPSPAVVIQRVLRAPPIPLEEREPHVPRDLLTIARKAMARESKERYPSARELAEDLRAFAHGQIVSAHAHSPVERIRRVVLRNKGPLAAFTIVLLLLAIFGAAGVSHVLDARDAARREQRAAERRADDITLAHARATAERDPTLAVAWLRTLSPAFDRWPEARAVAEEARARGVARRVIANIKPLAGLALSPDGRLVASFGADSPLRLRDVATGRQRPLPAGVDGRALALSKSRRLVAQSRFDGSIDRWDVERDPPRALPNLVVTAHALAFTPDERALLVVRDDGAVISYSLDDGAPTLLGAPIPDLDPAASVALSDDGRTVAIAAAGAVAIFDTTTRNIRTLPIRSGPVTSVALSASRNLVAAGTAARTVELWDLASGASRVLLGFDGPKVVVGLSADGTSLAAAGSADRAIRVYALGASTDGTVQLGSDDLPEDPAALRGWLEKAAEGADGLIAVEGR